MRRYLYPLSFVVVAALGFVSFWLITRTKAAPPKSNEKVQQTRDLQSYRLEFRKPDGSFYDDAALVQVLVDKGIVFHVKSPVKAEASERFSITFLGSRFNAQEQQKITVTFNDIMSSQFKVFEQHFKLVRLEKVFVTNEQKIQLFFNEEFKSVANDESRLTDFNSSLSGLGMVGLKGVEIFIEETPLGMYLKEVDAQRDAKALRGLQPQNSER